LPITQSMCTSFKAELMLAVHDFRATGGDTFKLALYTSSATVDANTTAYTASNEVTGTNYTAGGGTLTRLGVVTSNNTASTGVGFTDFSDLTFANATITARGALIYNNTPSANSNANTNSNATNTNSNTNFNTNANSKPCLRTRGNMNSTSTKISTISTQISTIRTIYDSTV
jgi:hypothetical protein